MRLCEPFEMNREEAREREREYEADVQYDVWRNGGNMDRIDDGRVEDAYYSGKSVEEAAAVELQKQRSKEEIEDVRIY